MTDDNRQLVASSDAFEKVISDETANELDIATQYNFSPERVRLFLNGSRQFPNYNSVPKFDDAADVWTLQPAGGDSMHIESAESGTYVVNYELQASFAFELNQSLSDGDVLRIGPYDGTDGWLFEQRGADHTDTQGDIIESSAGTETTLESNVELLKPTTDWTRIEVDYNWYAVGREEWAQTYTENGEQFNTTFAKTSNDGDRSTETGNLNLWQEIQADASTTGLELHVGSMGMITLGSPTTLTREKPQPKQITVSGTNNAWEPIYAIRVDPDNDNVNAQFSQLDILSYGANDDLELVAVSFDASKTDASGWGVPDYHHASNSVLQSTTSISQVPDTSGTQKDLGTSDKFGGHTIASAIDIDGGNVSGTTGTSNRNRQEKKAILASDHVVFLARTGTTGETLSFVWDVDQNW